MVKLKQQEIDNAKLWLTYKNDPARFMEEMCKIPTPGGDELIELYEPQKRILKDFYENDERNQIWLKSRQLGFSTLSQLICVHLCIFYKNVVIGIASRDGSEASDFCRKTTDIIDKLPNWIKPKYKWKNVQNFCTTSGNQLWSSPVSPANPGALFRGKSIVLLILDELAHILRVDEAWTGVAPALSKAQKTAKAKGIPYGTIFLSTPNKTFGTGSFFYKMWTGALCKTNSFTPKTIHWKEVKQLREDPDWYKTQCDILNNDQRKIKQELELEFIGSEGCVFDETVQSILQEATRQSNHIKKTDMKNGVLYQFKEPSKNKFHIVSVDTASAVGNDFSTIEVLEYDTLEQVYEYKGKLEPKKFAEVVKFVANYLINYIIVVENTGGFGIAVLNELQFDEKKRYNIYYGKQSNKLVPGLSTNSKTRPLILDSLVEIVKDNPNIIKSDRLACELISLTTKNGNKIEADKGFNDDLCLAYAFACYIRKYCRDSLNIEEDYDNDNEDEQNTSNHDLDIIYSLNDIKPMNDQERLIKNHLNNFNNLVRFINR